MSVAVIEVEMPGAVARFTGRAGGVSEAPYATLNLGRWTADDPTAVAENRRRAPHGRPLLSATQAHGQGVVPLADALRHEAPAGAVEEADGVATARRDVAAL